MNRNMFSPLSSPLSSPPATTPEKPSRRAIDEQPEHRNYDTDPGIISKHPSTNIECFNKHANIRGHYYSATELFDHGIWVGYLAPDRQNESYRNLPSYSELRTNCDDMDLPYPPGTASSSPKNRYAICGGCLSEQSVLLTLRELNYVHKKRLVVMPLDGDDDVGLSCILLPQPLDRSMKNIEAWRPYEVRNDGNGQKFDNNFVLYTLRYTDQDVGTKDTILAALESRKTGGTSESYTMGKSTSRVMPEAGSLGNLHLAFGVSPAKKQAGKKRKARKDSGTHRRQRPALQTPTSGLTPSALTKKQAQNIQMSWALDMNEESYEISLLMSECQSFSGMLDALRRLAESIPGARAFLENARSWSFSYPSASGGRKSRIAHRGTTEGAFEKMRADLAQGSLTREA